VDAIKDKDGEWCMDPTRIQQTLVDHFRELFTEDSTVMSAFTTESVAFPQLSLEATQELHQPFKREDILAALKAMQPLKAPGPEGFPAYFFPKVLACCREGSLYCGAPSPEWSPFAKCTE